MSNAMSGMAEAEGPTSESSPTSTTIKTAAQHVVEFVCDSGEGAQTAGQLFGSISAKMGNGVWTVEIIPAEIEPPFRSRAGASGNRVRVGSEEVTNMGDAADVVVAFNEQVLYSRIDVGALRPGTIVFLESKWAEDPTDAVRHEYAAAVADFESRGYIVREVPMETECLKVVPNARRGKNMWALGFLCALYERDKEKVLAEVRSKFERKGEKVIAANVALVEGGYRWAEENLNFRFRIAAREVTEQMVVMNGNQAAALGILAAGIELCSMYPITPATSVTHYLAAVIGKTGGFIHQAEDEIAAIGFAIGASYAGKTAVTVTSGPGLAFEDRVHRFGRDGGGSARHSRRSAWRALDGAPDTRRARRPAGGPLRRAGGRTEDRDGPFDHSGVLPLHGHRTLSRRGVPGAGDRADRRSTRDGPAAVRATRREG